ncbi:hypothetical protein N8I74_12275 [Chitiniphilus purpureus]|uniref:HTH cro/C1-type domain-containing protein n=1 Tax=Chitiniphilus purpureus TaxID=2981137 RepID=A0ABY6DIC4_9NEIS|nr:hypothetical protein [Chitiniphilus sp. CD1]UXY14095.1 hypothetical protein N8I74_12275 [Chitiniphilus sp. CD1]
METLDEILDAAKAALGKESDNQLALAMGVTRGAVSSWRIKRTAPDAYALMELQKILKVDARELLAIIEAERAKTEERRGYWEDVKRSFSTKGVSSVLAVATALALLGTPSRSDAGTTNSYRNANFVSVYYVKLDNRITVTEDHYCMNCRSSLPKELAYLEWL